MGAGQSTPPSFVSSPSPCRCSPLPLCLLCWYAPAPPHISFLLLTSHFLPASAAPKLLFSSDESLSLPFFSAWDTYYAQEARLRQGRSSKRKEQYESNPSEQGPAILEAKPISLPVFDPLTVRTPSGPTPRATFVASALITTAPVNEEPSEDVLLAERARLAEVRRQHALDMARIQELQRTDPLKAARELERLERKRSGVSSSQSAEPREADRPKKARKVVESAPVDADAAITELKANMAAAVMRALKPFLASGAIGDKDSFKHLCRKITKELVGKEKAKAANGVPRWHAKIPHGVDSYVQSYMGKLASRGVTKYVKE